MMYAYQPWDEFWQEIIGNGLLIVWVFCLIPMMFGWREQRRLGCRRRHPATKSHYYKARKGND